MKGRWIPISPPRRLITDFSYLAQGSPRGTVHGRIDVAAVAAARAAAAPRPSWPALFAKAHALAARELPALRRVYVKLPWPHFHQMPTSVACIIVERDWRGEAALFFGRIKDPASIPLPVLQARIAEAKTAPIESVKDYRLALRLARLPWPLRRAVLWLGLNLGRQVPNHFGSFGLSVLGSQRVAITSVVAPWTSFLNYGPIGADGMVDIHLGFDHRVLDGALAAQAVQALERMLQGPVLEELRGLAE